MLHFDYAPRAAPRVVRPIVIARRVWIVVIVVWPERRPVQVVDRRVRRGKPPERGTGRKLCRNGRAFRRVNPETIQQRRGVRQSVAVRIESGGAAAHAEHLDDAAVPLRLPHARRRVVRCDRHAHSDSEAQKVLRIECHGFGEGDTARSRRDRLIRREIEGVGICGTRRQIGRHRLGSTGADSELGQPDVERGCGLSAAVRHHERGLRTLAKKCALPTRSAGITLNRPTRYFDRLRKGDRRNVGGEWHEHHIGDAVHFLPLQRR